MTTLTVDTIPGYRTGTWTVDHAHTEIGFSVRHLAISKVKGVFERFDATVTAAENPHDSRVEVTVDMASINTKNAARDNHLRTNDFFQAEQYPTIEFVSTGVRIEGGEFKVDGDLTIKGVTKPVVLDVTLNKAGEHPMKKVPAIGFDATATVKRSDFGVGAYAPMVSDEVALKITTEATADAAK